MLIETIGRGFAPAVYLPVSLLAQAVSAESACMSHDCLSALFLQHTCTSTWYRMFTAQHSKRPEYLKHALLRGRSTASGATLGHALRGRLPLIGRVIWNLNITHEASLASPSEALTKDIMETTQLSRHLPQPYPHGSHLQSLCSLYSHLEDIWMTRALHNEGYSAFARR